MRCNLLKLRKSQEFLTARIFVWWPGTRRKGRKHKSIFGMNERKARKKSNIWIKASRLMFKWLNNWFIKMLKHQTYVPWTPTAQIFIYFINLLLDHQLCAVSIHHLPWDCRRKTIKTAETNRMQFKMLFLWVSNKIEFAVSWNFPISIKVATSRGISPTLNV